MVVIIRTKVTFKFNSQLVLLVAKLTIEAFPYFLDLSLNFLLSICHNLDFQNVQERGQKNPPGNKNSTRAPEVDVSL